MSDRETMAIVTNTGDGVGHCRCAECNKVIYWKDSYCRHCGCKIVDVVFVRSDYDSGKK